jgi:phage gpG-like protein
MSLFSAEIIGLAPVERMVVRLARPTSGMGKASLLRQLGALIAKQHTRRVLSEKTSPDGGRWAPLKPDTVKRKGNANILVESGKMARSWSLAYGADNVRMRNTATSSRGKGVLYLPFHQFGTSKMVARVVMGFSARNEVEIHQVVNAWVHRLIGIAA